MPEMTTYERMKRMYEHQEPDRVPIEDEPWGATLERWHKEGMPEDISFVDFFKLDKFKAINADNSPRYPEKVVEETEEYIISTTKWGVTFKNWKHKGSVPEYIGFTIKGPDTWKEAKERMQPTKDRIDWDGLKQNYKKWKEEGAWIRAILWFGFDVTHAWTVGTENILIAMGEQPEWVSDMFNHYLDVHLALFDMVWDAGYKFDEIAWPDDMGYKNKQFFSLDMYRNLLKPAHKRAADWAHEKGVKVRLHSCGNINPMIPDLIDIGINLLNPIEVKAGMDPIALKREYGDKLVFHGGLNALFYNHPEKMWTEMERIIPVMKENGGYMIGSDHSIPESCSLKDFQKFVDLAKKLGAY